MNESRLKSGCQRYFNGILIPSRKMGDILASRADELRDALSRSDRNGDGLLNFDEFKSGLHELGVRYVCVLVGVYVRLHVMYACMHECV